MHMNSFCAGQPVAALLNCSEPLSTWEASVSLLVLWTSYVPVPPGPFPFMKLSQPLHSDLWSWQPLSAWLRLVGVRFGNSIGPAWRQMPSLLLSGHELKGPPPAPVPAFQGQVWPGEHNPPSPQTALVPQPHILVVLSHFPESSAFYVQQMFLSPQPVFGRADRLNVCLGSCRPGILEYY